MFFHPQIPKSSCSRIPRFTTIAEPPEWRLPLLHRKTKYAEDLGTPPLPRFLRASLLATTRYSATAYTQCTGLQLVIFLYTVKKYDPLVLIPHSDRLLFAVSVCGTIWYAPRIPQADRSFFFLLNTRTHTHIHTPPPPHE